MLPVLPALLSQRSVIVSPRERSLSSEFSKLFISICLIALIFYPASVLYLLYSEKTLEIGTKLVWNPFD